MHDRARRGFTMVELVIVLAIIAVVVALTVPQMSEWRTRQRAKEAARSVADVLQLARTEAIRTSTNHVVYFATLGATDPAGTALEDPDLNAVPILVINDGPAATANCVIDAGETTSWISIVPGVGWGAAQATAPAPNDLPAAPFATGTTFQDPANNPVNWVAFRPDGIPVAFDAACAFGQTGSGGGSVYVTNGDHDYAITLSPLGGLRVHAWEESQGQWSN